jgi:hypothetical protein
MVRVEQRRRHAADEIGVVPALVARRDREEHRDELGARADDA